MEGIRSRVRTCAAAALVLVMVVTTLSGCTTTRPVALSPEGIGTVRPGDLVRVVTKNGEAYRFGVVEVTPTSLVGKSVKIDFADIERIDRREFSGMKTTPLVVGIVSLVALVIYALSQMTFMAG